MNLPHFEFRRPDSGIQKDFANLPISAHPRSFDRTGFTLIEVVISSALMALIIVSAYLCFSASIASRKTMEPRLEVIQNARVALALIAADLRAACPLDKDSAFLGMHRSLGDTVADNVDFATHNHTPRRAREGDFCQTSYYLDRDEETGGLSLWRRRNPTIAPDSLSGGTKEEIATGVLGLQFEYFDGLDWYDSWGDTSTRGKKQTSQKEQPNLTGMPEAVRITLWFDANPSSETRSGLAREDSKREAPMTFQTVARLNLAKASQTSAGDSQSSSAPASEPGSNGGTLQ
jgi:prepilin-type N-terminal cleavage/methylation domain-containing protein